MKVLKAEKSWSQTQAREPISVCGWLMDTVYVPVCSSGVVETQMRAAAAPFRSHAHAVSASPE